VHHVDDGVGEQGDAPQDQHAEWREPEPLVAAALPDPYPLDALPGTIRGAVEEVQAFIQAPVPLVASCALTAVSLSCQAHIDVERANGLAGPTSLFLLVVAESGERKTACDNLFKEEIKQYEKEQAKAGAPLRKDYNAAKRAWNAKCSGIDSKIKQGACGTGKRGKDIAALENELKDLYDNEPAPPRIPKILYMDATQEGLLRQLQNDWPSGGVASSEAGVVFGSHGMGKDSAMRNMSTLNLLWDGREVSTTRSSVESFHIEGARLTLSLQTQAGVVREFMERQGALGRSIGFWARQLFSWPVSTQGTRFFKDPPPGWPKLSAFKQRLREVLDEPAPINEDGQLEPHCLTFTPEAKALWVEFHNNVEWELREDGELIDIRDVASKAADNAARLAALFHFFEGHQGAINADTFERASRIVTWHLYEARRFLGTIAMPEDASNASKLGEWLVRESKRRGTPTLKRGEIQQRGPNRTRKSKPLDCALTVLSDADWIRYDDNKKLVTINPRLAEVVQ
jgi:putative DNA primase/helicase